MPDHTVILDDHACLLGEGSALDSITGRLRWFDIENLQRFEHDFRTGETRRTAMPEKASASAAVDDRLEMIFMASGLFLFDRATGKAEKIADIEADRPDMRSNDGRTHPSGAFWGATMALDQREEAGSIYWFAKGEVRRLFPGITIGNAICFAADGSYAHFADTAKNTIWKVRTNPRTGLPSGDPEVFHRTSADDPSRPDGAVLDRDNNLYCARWGGARVDVLAPDGQLLRSIAVDALNPTCPAFCGPDLSQFALTTAREGMSAEQLAAYPQSGKTLLVEAGCQGRLDPPVDLG